MVSRYFVIVLRDIITKYYTKSLELCRFLLLYYTEIMTLKIPKERDMEREVNCSEGAHVLVNYLDPALLYLGRRIGPGAWRD